MQVTHGVDIWAPVTGHNCSVRSSCNGGQVVNRVVGFLVARVGLNLQGAEVLDVRGRRSGEVRSVVVNPLEIGGELYFVSARRERASCGEDVTSGRFRFMRS